MNKSVLCIGATLVDELYFCENNVISASSNPAQKATSIGGVISNIAQHLALLEVSPTIITAIGNDAEGLYIKNSFLKSGIAFSLYNHQRQNEFPSFYSSKSGYASPLRLDTAKAIAQLLRAKWDLALTGSVLIANPVPAEYEMEPAVIEKHILKALSEANIQGIKGKAVTPFLLKFIADNTEGESLEANIALIKNNAKVAAEIAVALKG